MKIKLTFLGACKSVTGSRFLLDISGTRLLVDCGLHQERNLNDRDWGPFPVPPESVNAVLLTHAHLDHCGFLPKFVRQGFSRRIYGTSATMEIAKIMLLDAANIQETDAENKKRRHQINGVRGPHPEIPLYTVKETQSCFTLFNTLNYQEKLELASGIEARYYNAGHVLGAAIIELVIREGQEIRRFVFSGDIGRWHRPIVEDPTVFEQADYVITESTYADRTLADGEDLLAELATIVNETVRAGGNLIIPSFALERAQDILYYLFQALEKGMIEPINVYLDSPMAIGITDVFERHVDLFDNEMQTLIKKKKTPFHFPGLHMISSLNDSKKLNTMSEPSIIIAGSGMATGGRIKYHIAKNINRPESTIMFAGYQAIGTLGRNIVDEPEEVRILGDYYPVKAHIIQMHGFSSHADRTQLLKWNYSFKTAPRHLFVVHGENEAANHLAVTIRSEKGWQVSVPNYLEEFSLD